MLLATRIGKHVEADVDVDGVEGGADEIVRVSRSVRLRPGCGGILHADVDRLTRPGGTRLGDDERESGERAEGTHDRRRRGRRNGDRQARRRSPRKRRSARAGDLPLTAPARDPIMWAMTSTARGYRYYAYPTLTVRRR